MPKYKNATKPGPIPGTLLIKLTKGKETVADDAPAVREVLKKHRFHFHNGTARTHIAGGHKIVMLQTLIKGSAPPGMEIGHRNGDKLDNRMENLIYVTRRTNAVISGHKSNNTSGMVGVRRRERDKAWVAYWKAENGKVISVYFADSKYGGYEGAKRMAADRRATETAKLVTYKSAKTIGTHISRPDEEAAKLIDERLSALKGYKPTQ